MPAVFNLLLVLFTTIFYAIQGNTVSQRWRNKENALTMSSATLNAKHLSAIFSSTFSLVFGAKHSSFNTMRLLSFCWLFKLQLAAHFGVAVTAFTLLFDYLLAFLLFIFLYFIYFPFILLFSLNFFDLIILNLFFSTANLLLEISLTRTW